MDAPDGSALLGEWLTPNVPNGGRSVSAQLVASKGMTEDGIKRTINLESQSKHWATPTTMAAKGVGYQRQLDGSNTPILSGQAEHWPSPGATDGTKGGPNQAGSKGDLMLPSAAAQWPTPSASVANDGESPETWHARAALLKVKHGNGNGVGLPLTVAAVQWPTPASRDYRTPNSQESQESQESRNHTGGEQLPNFVEHHFLPLVQPTLSGQSSSTPVVSVHGAELSPTTKPEHVLGRLRLNPAFGCWLMGWPSWWTNPGLTSSAKSAMVSYRFVLRSHLSLLCGEPAKGFPMLEISTRATA
jgi:hypothetical protein